jgi:hypothetical protein
METAAVRAAVKGWGEMNKREIDPLGHRQLLALVESLEWEDTSTAPPGSAGGIARRARMACIGHGWHKTCTVHFVFGLNLELSDGGAAPAAGAADDGADGCGLLRFWICAMATPNEVPQEKEKKKKHKKARPARPVPEAAQADIALFATVDSAGTGAEMRSNTAEDFEDEIPELQWPLGATTAAEAAALGGSAPRGQPLVAFCGRVQAASGASGAATPKFSQHKCVVACAALDAVRRIVVPDVEQRVDVLEMLFATGFVPDTPACCGADLKQALLEEDMYEACDEEGEDEMIGDLELGGADTAAKDAGACGASAQPEQRRCLDFQAGKCRFGDRCRMLHTKGGGAGAQTAGDMAAQALAAENFRRMMRGLPILAPVEPEAVAEPVAEPVAESKEERRARKKAKKERRKKEEAAAAAAASS